MDYLAIMSTRSKYFLVKEGQFQLDDGYLRQLSDILHAQGVDNPLAWVLKAMAKDFTLKTHYATWDEMTDDFDRAYQNLWR